MKNRKQHVKSTHITLKHARHSMLSRRLLSLTQIRQCPNTGRGFSIIHGSLLPGDSERDVDFEPFMLDPQKFAVNPHSDESVAGFIEEPEIYNIT